MNYIQPIADKEAQIVAMRDSAQRHLQAIKTIDDGTEYLSKMKALEAYAKATKQGAEIVLMVQEQKLRSMRILGGLLEEMEVSKNSSNHYLLGTSSLPSKLYLSDLGITKNESSTYQRISKIPSELFEAYIETAKRENSTTSEITVSGIIRVARQAENGIPHISNNSGDNEWYTPPEFIEAARSVLECIDLDPASSDHAQQVVKAAQYYTIETDGLSKDWAGRVWMNPPYGAGEIEPFCEKLTRHYLQRDIQEAIVLVNNATETRWFQDMAQQAQAICFPKGRIRYYGSDGERNSPLQGQALLYFGDRASRFFLHFSNIGLCVTIS